MKVAHMTDPVQYIERTHDYYVAHDSPPYEWAQLDPGPIAALDKPLSECRLAVVSTSDVAVRSAPDGPRDKSGENRVGGVYDVASDTPPELLYSRQEHYDRYATNLDDVNAYFPVSRLRDAVASGRVGSLASQFIGVLTGFSHEQTMHVDAPEVLRRLRDQDVDIALLTPI